MIHLEDNWLDDSDSMVFVIHSDALKNGAHLFKSHGAKYTAESAIPFAGGCMNWNTNTLQALLDSTMGVGSHANSSDAYVFTKFLVDGLVGPANNRGVSGGCSPSDTEGSNNWIDSAYQAGFEYVNGIVHYSFLNIPLAERPGMVTDWAIIDSLGHYPVPPDFTERIYPHRASSGFDWLNETTGPVVMLTGSIGELSSLSEGYHNCAPNCVLDSADIDSLVTAINLAVNLSSNTEKLTMIYVHNPLRLFVPQNDIFYEYLFESLLPLKNDGKIEYVTFGEAYDNFIECEAASINENARLRFSVYPNPSFGMLTLDLSPYSHGTIVLSDMLGKEVLRKPFASGKVVLNLGYLLSKGSYIAKVLNDEGNVISVEKLIYQ